MIRKTPIAAMIGGFLLAGGVVPSQARDRDDRCEQRVRRAEANLQKEIHRHGEHSRQAEKRRREVEQARARCRADEHHDHDRH